MLTSLFFVVSVIAGYLVGSVCSAVIVCRIFALPDPCIEGSQNPGATNVLRLAGKKYAIMVLLADMLKGFLPVIIVTMLGAGTFIASLTCLAAVLGHIYPIFFKFKGGKGVATAIGALLALNFILGILVLTAWLLIAISTRYSSLASIVSISLSPFFYFFIVVDKVSLMPLIILTIVIIYTHRKNISRLSNNTEPKINLRKKL
jgi:glycerol-3-phosphate acyltransferase PlsY